MNLRKADLDCRRYSILFQLVQNILFVIIYNKKFTENFTTMDSQILKKNSIRIGENSSIKLSEKFKA